MDYILDNINTLFLLLPLAVFIGLRISQARKKVEGRTAETDEDLKGFHSEEAPWKDSYILLPETAALPSALPAAKPATPHAAKPSALPAAKPANLPAVKPAALPKDNKATDPNPNEEAEKSVQSKIISIGVRISSLPPLQQAVVMSEILGPPRGF